MTSILLVEDEPAIRRGLSDKLAMEGWRVEATGDGAEGLALALAGDHDLIVLDLMLPGLGGLEICRRLRAAGCTAQIVMLTAKGQEEDKIAGLDTGADDYITKPFSPRELVARLRARLRRTQPADVLRVGRLELDLAGRRVSKDGVEVALAPLELEVLQLLVEQRGKAISRARFIDEIWGGGERAPSTRTVDVHILKLRQKLEDDPAQPRLIATVHGIGYRLDA